MTVEQLRTALEGLPDNMDVFMDERKTDFSYGLLNSVRIDQINFMEEPNGRVFSCDHVVILDEE